MKISNIAQKCKSSKYALIVDTGAYQFLGNGQAMYKVAGLPVLEPGNIPALFGLSEKDWLENWASSIASADIAGVSFDDIDPLDEMTDQPYTSIVLNGEIIRCFVGLSSREMIFVKSWYLENFDPGIVDYYIRRTSKGRPVLAVKQGMLTEGIIYPVSVAPKALSDKLYDFAAAVSKQCSNYEYVEDSLQVQFDEDGELYHEEVGDTDNE